MNENNNFPIVKINGVETSSATFEDNSYVNWEVSCVGYETQSGTDIISSDVIKNIVLLPKTYNLFITTTPINAEVKINNVEQRAFNGEYGDVAQVEVSSPNYVTQTFNVTLTKDKVVNVVLEKVEYTATFNITPITAGLLVDNNPISLINENDILVGNVPNIKYGDTISYKVIDPTGFYIKTSNSAVITNNETFVINLVKFKRIVTITTNITNVTVTIGGEVVTSSTNEFTKEFDIGTTNINWVVQSNSGSGESQSGVIANLLQDTNINVTLDVRVLTILAIPTTSTFLVNNIEYGGIIENNVVKLEYSTLYGSNITYTVGAIGYQPFTENITITNNVTKNVSLTELVTLTVNATPNDAIITLITPNETVIANSIDVLPNTLVNYKVEKVGYVTQEGQVNVIGDQTLDITLESLPDYKYIIVGDNGGTI